MALVVAMAFATPAYAATSKTVAYQDFTSKTKVIKKKATIVKKGTTKLTFKKGQGYVRFKAPSTKTYTFYFKNAKQSKGVCGFVEVQTPDKSDSSYSFLTKVKTQGGNSNTLWLTFNGAKSTGKGVDRNLPSRYAKIKLKKGQEIYFYFYAAYNTKATATFIAK